MNYHVLGVLPPGVEVLDGGGLTSPRDSGKLRSTLKIHEGGPKLTDTTPLASSSQQADVCRTAFHAFNRYNRLLTVANTFPDDAGADLLPYEILDSDEASDSWLLIKSSIDLVEEWDPLEADYLRAEMNPKRPLSRRMIEYLADTMFNLATFLAPDAARSAKIVNILRL